MVHDEGEGRERESNGKEKESTKKKGIRWRGRVWLCAGDVKRCKALGVGVDDRERRGSSLPVDGNGAVWRGGEKGRVWA